VVEPGVIGGELARRSVQVEALRRKLTLDGCFCRRVTCRARILLLVTSGRHVGPNVPFAPEASFQNRYLSKVAELVRFVLEETHNSSAAQALIRSRIRSLVQSSRCSSSGSAKNSE
jgi:hypothetical protein